MLSVNKNMVKLSPFPLSRSETSDIFAFETRRLCDDNTYAWTNRKSTIKFRMYDASKCVNRRTGIWIRRRGGEMQISRQHLIKHLNFTIDSFTCILRSVRGLILWSWEDIFNGQCLAKLNRLRTSVGRFTMSMKNGTCKTLAAANVVKCGLEQTYVHVTQEYVKWNEQNISIL